MAAQPIRSARKTSARTALHKQIDTLNQQAIDSLDIIPDQAIKICEENRLLLRKTNYPQGTIRNELTFAAALCYVFRHEEAIEILREVHPLCLTPNQEDSLPELHYTFGMAYAGVPDYSQALFHAEESLQFAQTLKIELDRGKGELLLGTICLLIDLWDKSLEHALTALAIFEEIDNPGGISKALNNIGTIYNEAHQFNRAIEFFEKSLAIKREIGDAHGVANTLNNIANILFWFNHEYDRALEYYYESLDISRAHGYTLHTAKSLQHIGQIHVYVGRNKDAIQYSLEGLKLQRTLGRNPDLAYALMDLGFVYCQAGEMQKSIHSIKKGLKIAQDFKATVYINKAYNLLRQIYREIKDFENATKYNELYIEAQKRFFSEESEKRMQRLTIQFEVEKTRQEKELYRLRTESLRQEMEHKSKELATMAMYLMQKNEFLTSLSRQIDNAPYIADRNARALLDSLQQQIQETVRGEKNWESFEQQFKLVHHDFIGRLLEHYPTLTPIELKVGALLRMNLSTKEIASLLYQSPRSIESYRYRLRSKMDISSTTNLSTFLASL